MISKGTGCISAIIVLLGLFLPALIYPPQQGIQNEIEATLAAEGSTQTVVIVPTSTQETPFALENNRILYGHSSTMDCQFIIGGNIVDQNHQFVYDVTVHIESLEIEDMPSAISYAQPTEASGIDDLPGWSVLLPNRTVDYQIWISRERDGEAISPIVIVPFGTCDRNQAVINFIQVSPLK